MQKIEVELFYLAACIGVASFFGFLSILGVFISHVIQQRKIIEAMDNDRRNNAVAISGKGNTYNDKKAHPD